VVPAAEGALREGERGAEIGLGDAVVAAQAIRGGDDLVLQLAVMLRDAARGEHGVGDAEQRLRRSGAGRVGRRRRCGPPAASGRSGDQGLELREQGGLEAREALGARAVRGDELRDGSGEPGAIVGGNDAGAEEREQATWLTAGSRGR